MYGFAIAYGLLSSLSGANSPLSLCGAIWHLNIKSHEGDSGLSRGFGAYFGKKLLAASDYAMRPLHKVPKRPIMLSPQIWGSALHPCRSRGFALPFSPSTGALSPTMGNRSFGLIAVRMGYHCKGFDSSKTVRQSVHLI